MKSFDKTWSTGGGNDNPLRWSHLENPMNSMERQKDITLENESLGSESVQYATGEEHRAITNGSRMKEAAAPKLK